jgi:hypothetical protein
MSLIDERLCSLWEREAMPSPAVSPKMEPEPSPSTMGVTFRTPMIISGANLKPGRYVFHLPDPGTHPNCVTIFNADQTQLVASVMIAGGAALLDQWN